MMLGIILIGLATLGITFISSTNPYSGLVYYSSLCAELRHLRGYGI